LPGVLDEQVFVLGREALDLSRDW